MKIIIKTHKIVEFEKLDKDKVRDHCHLRGKYRGAAHSQCNLKLKLP